jgi:hypothetical protein
LLKCLQDPQNARHHTLGNTAGNPGSRDGLYNANAINTLGQEHVLSKPQEDMK